MDFKKIFNCFPFARKTFARKVNLSDALSHAYGIHRSGWSYAIRGLEKLHNPEGVLLDPFIERTFKWAPEGVKPHLEPWVGFIHIPPRLPKWFLYDQSNEIIFSTEAWKRSLPYCKGLFTLSRYHKDDLNKKLDIPVNSLIHPTETPEIKWSMEKFVSNRDKKLVQVGWWLRKLHTIFQIRTRKYKKVFLKVGHIKKLDILLQEERRMLEEEGVFDDTMYETAETVSFMSDAEYDKLLSENIAIINLYDSSANNTIIECIVRNTPLLVNPHEAVVEYLGEEYPFYFNSLEEAVRKAEDFDVVYDSYKYLLDNPIKEKLTAEYFLKSFAESEIYRAL